MVTLLIMKFTFPSKLTLQNGDVSHKITSILCLNEKKKNILCNEIYVDIDCNI